MSELDNGPKVATTLLPQEMGRLSFVVMTNLATTLTNTSPFRIALRDTAFADAPENFFGQQEEDTTREIKTTTHTVRFRNDKVPHQVTWKSTRFPPFSQGLLEKNPVVISELTIAQFDPYWTKRLAAVEVNNTYVEGRHGEVLGFGQGDITIFRDSGSRFLEGLEAINALPKVFGKFYKPMLANPAQGNLEKIFTDISRMITYAPVEPFSQTEPGGNIYLSTSITSQSGKMVTVGIATTGRDIDPYEVSVEGVASVIRTIPNGNPAIATDIYKASALI